MARSIAAFVIDPVPSNYFAIDRAFMQLLVPPAERAIETALSHSPAGGRFLRERYLAAPYTLDDLARCAPGTLGQVYRDHMLRFGLSLDFFPPEVPSTDFRYYRARTFQMHDIIHVVVGHGADVSGEMGVIGVMLAQADRYFGKSALSVATYGYGGLMGALYSLNTLARKPAAVAKYADVLADGYRVGKRAAPLLTTHWEEYFDRPLADLRLEHGIA